MDASGVDVVPDLVALVRLWVEENFPSIVLNRGGDAANKDLTRYIFVRHIDVLCWYKEIVKCENISYAEETKHFVLYAADPEFFEKLAEYLKTF